MNCPNFVNAIKDSVHANKDINEVYFIKIKMQ